MLIQRATKLMMSVLMVVTILSPLAGSAATGNQNLRASIYGGSTVSSYSYKKEKTGSFNYQAKPAASGGWSSKGDEWVYIRGRSGNGSQQATGLAHRNYYGQSTSGYLVYTSGHGSIGKFYAIAIEYDNSNPYQYVNLAMTWTP